MMHGQARSPEYWLACVQGLIDPLSAKECIWLTPHHWLANWFKSNTASHFALPFAPGIGAGLAHCLRVYPV
jgi:hypothetical protein